MAENPNIGRIRARAIEGLNRWMSDLATLNQARVSPQAASQFMDTIDNIEKWRQNQMGFWTSLWRLFTQSSRQPIADLMMVRAETLMGHYHNAHGAYQQIRVKTAQELVAHWDQINPQFDIFYTSMDQILRLSQEHLLQTYPHGEETPLELMGNIFDAEDAYNTPMAMALTNLFLIEEQAQEAKNLRRWSDDVAEYANYFEIPLHIRLNVLNQLSILDLTQPASIERVQHILTGLITNSKLGDNEAASFYYDPDLVARGECVRLVDTLRTHCEARFAPDSQQPDPNRMRCVAQGLGQGEAVPAESSLDWVTAAKGGAPPPTAPKATYDEHRAVITYLHAWCCDGRGSATRLPLMQGYFASITAEVNAGLAEGRTRMERFKRHMVRSLGKQTSNHANSIWLVDTMWRNLDAVFPGCIRTDRNFGEAELGLDEAKAHLAEMSFGGRRKRKKTRRKRKRKRKKTKRKRKKTRRKSKRRRKKRTRRRKK
jgi:hypothetical protein